MPTRKNFRRKRRSIRGGASYKKTAKSFVNKSIGQVSKMYKNVAAKVATAKTLNKPRNTLKRCPNDLTKELTKGRMVIAEGDIYFIKSINNDNNDNIELSNGKNTKNTKKDNIKPYNYHDILDKISILLDIIVKNKYLKYDDDSKIIKYIEIIKHIDSILNKINKIDLYSVVEEHHVEQVVAVDTANQNGGSCIEDKPSQGRLVQYVNDFYYVSLNGNQIVNGTAFFNIKNNISPNDNDVSPNDVSPNDLSPYDYDKVLSSLLSLIKIILEKKYLYNNDDDDNSNHLDKMEIIKEIINELNEIDKIEKTNDDYFKNNESVPNPIQTSVRHMLT